MTPSYCLAVELDMIDRIESLSNEDIDELRNINHKLINAAKDRLSDTINVDH